VGWLPSLPPLVLLATYHARPRESRRRRCQQPTFIRNMKHSSITAAAAGDGGGCGQKSLIDRFKECQGEGGYSCGVCQCARSHGQVSKNCFDQSSFFLSQPAKLA
jgi:hypothetical protein